MFRSRGYILCSKNFLTCSSIYATNSQSIVLDFQQFRNNTTLPAVTKKDYLGANKLTPPDDIDDSIPIKKYYTHERTKPLRLLEPANLQNDTVLQKDIIFRKVLSNVRSIEEHNNLCIKARKLYYDNRRQEGRWIPSLHDIEDILLKQTLTLGPTLDGVIQIKIPPAWSKNYLCSVDEFLIEIAKIYDCTAELACPDEFHAYTNFNISGPEICVRKFLAFLIQTTPHLKITRQLVTQTLVRYVSSERRRRRLPAHMISQPDQWTATSLLEYVEDLTAFDPSPDFLRFVHSPLSSDKTNYCVFIMNVIRRLIDLPITRTFFSRLAFHRAMNYFLRKNRIEFIRELYLKMDFIGIKCTTETYNIMLRASALKEDYHNFHFILKMMIRDGLRPDGRTWIAFIMAVPDREVKYRLLKRMKEKNLLSKTKTLQDVVEQLVKYDVIDSINKGQDHFTFLEEMNSKYGSKWLSVDVANRILTVLGRHLLNDRAINFLDYMEECSIYPDIWSVNIMLHSCSLSPNPLLALTDLLSHIKFRDLLEPNLETSRILFRLARITRSYNLAKVVWRYACLSATTTMRLRNQVARSLEKSLVSEKGYGNLVWERDIGPIIIGPRKQQHPFLLISKTSSDADEDQNSIWSDSEPKGPPDDNCNKRLINWDLQIFKYWRPSKPFGATIWLALQVDLEWRKQEVFKQKDLKWIINNSFYVQISEKYGEFKRIDWY
ncbi:hypothetical protein HI914_03509 [Erysiphe necator]|nr:hypothetical protein HI914_03509 [Erysiphe necator]